MTVKQEKQYWRAWGKARKVLRDRGLSPALADAARKEIHRDIGAVYPARHEKAGEPKSHHDLTWRGDGDELTKFFARCAALAEPGNLKPQMKAQEQTEIKSRWVADRLMGQIGKIPHEFDDYLNTVAENTCGKKLLYCHSAQDWRKIIGALTRTAKYKSQDKAWPERERAAGQPGQSQAAKSTVILIPPSSPDDIADDAGDAFYEPRQAVATGDGVVDPNVPF